MKLLILTSSFPPKLDSAAQHMQALCDAMLKRGHLIDVCTQTTNQEEGWDNAKVFRPPKSFFDSHGYILRLLREITIPLYLYLRYRQIRKTRYDYIITYSPSIFWLILIKMVSIKHRPKSILILRDIFPDWAIQIGLLKAGWQSHFLNYIASLLYHSSDQILVQSRMDQATLIEKKINPDIIDILYSWYDPADFIMNESVKTSGQKRYCVYVGNLGVAQNRNLFVNIIKEAAIINTSLDFKFIGLKKEDELYFKNEVRGLNNILFYPGMTGKNLATVVSQSQFGMYSLDQKILANNIPGKYIYYACCGLPSIGVVGRNDEIANLNEKYNFGSTVATSKDFRNFISTKGHERFNRSEIQSLAHQEFSVDNVFAKIKGREL